MRIRKCIAGLIIVGSILAGTAHGGEVTRSYDGLTLNGNLELADGKELADGVILITHGGLAHRGMEIIVYLQDLFKEKGYNTLAINLSLGLDNRHGMYDCGVTHRHRNQDAADEINGWVRWLKDQGVEQVVLLGHSRGGAQTALAAQHNDPLVKAVALMAPATADNNTPAEYQRRYGQALEPLLEKASKLVSNGRAGSVLTQVGLMNCRDASATAEAFVSYYGQSPTLDTPYLLPTIKAPTLVIVAGSDEVVKDLDKKIASMVDGERLRMKVIDGAGHFFRDLNADDAADAIDSFLQETGF